MGRLQLNFTSTRSASLALATRDSHMSTETTAGMQKVNILMDRQTSSSYDNHFAIVWLIRT
jgi:hypothetical protein